MFVEKRSLRELAVGFAPRKGANVTCHKPDDAGWNGLVSSDTRPHDYGTAILVVAFDIFMRIAMHP